MDFIGDLEFEGAPPPHSGLGAAFAVSDRALEVDRVEQLRAVVEEITRRPIERSARRIGFLP